MRRRYAYASALVATLLLPVLPMAVSGGSASAATGETYSRPASGVFNFTGHGWGHGHGMSQWGAEGAAAHGVSARTIMDHYYPGTQATTIANTTVRVKLTGTNSWDLAVLPASGLTMTDGTGRHPYRLTAPASMWRVVADSTGQHLQRYVGGRWSPVTVPGLPKLTTPITFSDSASLISVVYPSLYSRDYRGTVTSYGIGGGSAVNVATIRMEDYLRGVVPQEASPSWHPAALQAQAIAARTYAAQSRASAGIWSMYDICDSSACQAFGGARLRTPSGAIIPVEYPQTDAAVAVTAGSIRTYGGRPAFTQFSSSNGGYSTGGGYPYLVAKADPWDGLDPANSMHTWHATLPVSTLEAHYPAVGHLLRLRVINRDGNGEWGGRIGTVVLEGVDRAGHATSVTTSAGSIYYARAFGSYSDGLRSDWWTITNGAAGTPTPTPKSTPARKPYVATLISGPASVTMSANGYAFVTLRWRNDGTLTWQLDGGVQLGTYNPAFRNSPSSGWGWPSAALVGVLTADTRGAKTVPPGHTASISFGIWGDSRARGVTRESFQPFRYLAGWFGGTATITVTRR